VEYASTFLMSHCLSAIVAAKQGRHARHPRPPRSRPGHGENRLQRNEIDAGRHHGRGVDERGDGRRPAIASGSQVYRGICADLPVQPRNRKSVIAVTVRRPPPARSGVREHVPKSSEPVDQKIMNHRDQ